MSLPLSILILEDNPSDVELVLREIRRAGFESAFQRVETKSEFLAALESAPELILADYALPEFDGISALRLLQERDLDIPFILVSATIGEELAVTAMKMGATDYLLKDRLARLGPAVTGALEEKKLRAEKNRAEQALQANEKRFRALIENSNDAIALADVDGNILYASPAAGKILGIAAEMLVGKSTFDGIHLEDLARAKEIFERVRRNPGTTEMSIFRFRHKDGSWRWIEGIGTNMLNEPSVRAMVANYRDITERKRAEEALRESEERFSKAFRSSPLGTSITRLSDGRIVDVNESYCRTTGYTREELLGHTTSELHLIRGAERGQFAQQFQDKERQPDLEVTFVSKGGEEKTILLSVEQIVLGGEPHVLATAHDITERKRAGEALRESQERFRTWIENSSDLVTVVGIDGTIQYESPSIEHLLGYKQEELIGTNAFDLIHPDDRERVLGIFAQNIQTPERAASAEFRLRHHDGSWRSFEGVGKSYLDEHGQVAGLIHSRDITERKQAEEAKRKSEQVLQQAEKLGHTGSWEHNLVTGEIFNSEENLRLFFGDDRSKGTPFEDYAQAVHRDDREYVMRRHEQLLAEGSPPDIEYRVVWPDGSVHVIFGLANVVRDESGQAIRVYGTNVEITERKRAEEKIKRRAEEFEALFGIGRELAQQHELPIVLEQFATSAMKLVRAPAVTLSLFDASKGELETVVVKNFPAEFTRTIKLGEGISGRVAATRQNMIVDDYRSSEFRLTHLENSPMRAQLQVPMVYHGELLGVLSLHELGESTRKFTEEDANLLTLLASQAAGVVHSARLLNETRRHVQYLQALHQIDMAISGSVDLQVTFNIFLEHAKTQLGVDAADVLVFNPSTQLLDYTAARGFSTPALRHTHLRLGEGLAGRAALERKTIAIADLPNEMGGLARSPFIRDEGFVFYYGVPLIAKGRVNGVLEVFSRTPLQSDQAWLDFLETLAGQAAIAIDNAELFGDLQHANVELGLAYDTTLEGWSHALDLRDHETEGHTQRVTETTLRLARAMGMNDAELIHVRRGALLHDIGKMGIPDSILLKPGSLTDSEWEVMRQHPDLAYQMLAPIEYLRPALDIPLCHHEKWDGTGYPRGLKGEQVPLAARIFAIVDVWDALRSDRPYRKAWDEEKVREHILAGSGTHFDPKVVGVFLKMDG